MASGAAFSRAETLIDQVEKGNTKVSKLVGRIEGGMSSSERKIAEGEASAELLSSKRALDELRTAMRGLKKTERYKISSRHERCRNDFESLRKRFTAAKEAAARSDLLGGSKAEAARAERDRLQSTQGTLDGTSGHISDAHRTLASTLAQGTATADLMSSQTASLLRTKDHVEGTQMQADLAGGTVRDIRARAWTNKCLLGLAMLMLLAANIAVLLFGHGLIHNGGSSSSSSSSGGGGGGGGGSK